MWTKLKTDQLEKQVKQKHEEIRNMASKIHMIYEDEVVPVPVPSFSWVEIAENVESIECSLTNAISTVVNVRFNKGGFLREHHHDREEIIHVIEGEIEVNGDIVKEGQSCRIPAYQLHWIKSDYARLTMVFRPPFPKEALEASTQH